MSAARPLERIDRMARYLLQRDVTTHVRHGSSWQPTPRQRRRLDHKARHAAAPFGRDYTAEAHELVTSLETGEQRAEPLSAPVSPQQFIMGRQTEHGPIEPPQFMVRQDDPAFVPKVVAALLDPADTVKPERERSAINRNGYRVVDRRGEHRS